MTTRALQVCLVGLVCALLIVGVVSGTVLRHIVQGLPAFAVLIVLARRPEFAGYAALPIFVVWIIIPVLIWLFLAGLSRIANGHYTPIEIICTVLMAGFSAFGIVQGVALGRSLPVVRRVLAFVIFGAFEFGAMWVSFQRGIADR